MNVALVRGVVTRDPHIRTLAGEVTLATFDLAVEPDDGPRTTVPVVLRLGGAGTQDPPGAGDEVVVVGSVQRRFFRAGGSTQSRTEVVVEALAPAHDRRRVRRLLTAASARLAG
jgi:single-strand DNA-binding protein